jgi:hypothetical protein
MGWTNKTLFFRRLHVCCWLKDVGVITKSPNLQNQSDCERAHDLESQRHYRLTAKGLRIALLLLLFPKHLSSPFANSRFHYQPNSKLETAYHKDQAIRQIVDLLATV